MKPHPAERTPFHVAENDHGIYICLVQPARAAKVTTQEVRIGGYPLILIDRDEETGEPFGIEVLK